LNLGLWVAVQTPATFSSDQKSHIVDAIETKVTSLKLHFDKTSPRKEKSLKLGYVGFSSNSNNLFLEAAIHIVDELLT
jgi:hypothetical protein